MTRTGLIRVPLTELRTNDEQVIGSVYEVKNKTYRFVKNAGSTDLVARASCMEMLTSNEDGMKTRVIAGDGMGTSTAFIGLPAGMPVAGIGKSGSGTGAFGWVQCKGPAKVSIHQMATAIAAGSFAIGTSVLPASQPFGKAYIRTADSAATAKLYTRGVIIMEAIATTGAATAVSALVDIQCLS
ncbi:hypothetical protein LCGC14_1681250 [marine sediment metagenome]|uniref:Uncharacterized protein n=1 Tax=marine sediment metagenome TaxID=412755 RepID=A0A0F9K454_9ZZZZ